MGYNVEPLRTQDEISTFKFFISRNTYGWIGYTYIDRKNKVCDNIKKHTEEKEDTSNRRERRSREQ